MIFSNLIIIAILFLVALVAIYVLYSVILFPGITKGDDLQLSTKNILEQVQILYDQGEYALAELLATKYLDRVPSHMGVRKCLAKSYLANKKYNQALAQCNIVLRKRPQDTEIHLVMAKCYLKKRFYNKAIDAFYFVYKHNKNDAEIVRTLAELYIKTEQIKMAIEAYGELVELTEKPEEAADIHLIIAELNESIYDYPPAFEAYKARLIILPKDVDTNRKLAELYIKIENYPMAIETLLLMLSFVTEPKILLWIFETLIDLYEKTEDYEKAIAYSEKLLDIPGSDKFKARNRIANFYLKIGNIENSILILEDLSMMTQNGLEVTIELAAAYIEHGDYQKALDKYLILLEKATSKEVKIVNTLISDLYIKWSQPATDAKDYKRAMELLENALQYSPISSEAYYYVAKNQFLQKNYPNTVEALSKALNYEKEENNYVRYYLLLSLAHHELGNFFEEKKALSDLLNIDDKNPEGLYRVGLMYANQRDIKSAEEAFEKAIRYDPDFIQAKYNLAVIYENSNKDRAKELYMEVLEQDPTFIEAKNALADMAITDAF